jgi:NADH-quinone oxidoreductase subunit N
MWVPDVYQGAPTPVTLYLGSAPKIAAFAMIMRLLVESIGALQSEWQGMLIALAVLSLAIGNVVAIAQTNLKRMLAYSTISHVGFLLLGILSGTQQGYAASMFYIITYALMAAGAFGMIILLSRAGFEADEIGDFKGLNQRNSWFAFMMLILMFSMAGVPPTVGFYAKLSVLEAVIDIDMIWLAAVAVFFSVIGAFYYIRLIKVMYFDTAEDDQPLASQFDLRLGLTANGLAVLLLGIFPGSLMALCHQVIS